MLWQFFSLPGIENGIEYRYFSRYRIEVRNSSIVTTLVYLHHELFSQITTSEFVNIYTVYVRFKILPTVNPFLSWRHIDTHICCIYSWTSGSQRRRSTIRLCSLLSAGLVKRVWPAPDQWLRDQMAVCWAGFTSPVAMSCMCFCVAEVFFLFSHCTPQGA